MSVSKAWDMAHVRFRAPDLSVMDRFLNAFGMVEAGRSATALYKRGHGTQPFAHVTELGDPAFAGFGIQLNSVDELEKLAAHENAQVEMSNEPGGGYVVRLTDPDGFAVDALAGQTMADILSMPRGQEWNQDGRYSRLNDPKRPEKGPSHVLRLGHVVLGVSDFRRSEAWYKDRFGFITSDEIQPQPGIAIGAFMRCDRGDRPCDHHSLFLLERPAPCFMHAAFEVANLDDLMVGHDHLVAQGYDHLWGVGRHYLGSQIFDYWRDPYGHEVEHWTDGDQLVAADGGGIGTIPELMGVQWGMEMPPLPEEVGRG
ncbi:MAG: glyoxalase [Sphingobium sp. 66-54]|nr:MAG: glyoxalase [Sphingobium sp. 66-54]